MNREILTFLGEIRPPSSPPGETTDERLAARCAARYTMYRPHRCTGKGCAKRGHKTGRRRLDDALTALGLIPDPVTPASRKWQYGAAKEDMT